MGAPVRDTVTGDTLSSLSRVSQLDGDVVALQPELAHSFRRVGLQLVRATVVDIGSLDFGPEWSIQHNGSVVEASAARATSGLFPGAATLVAGLASAAADHSRVQRLSPRLWACAWRVSHDAAVLAEAMYREKRDTLGDADVALIRLICSASVHVVRMPSGVDASSGTASAAGVADSAVDVGTTWPRVERRSRRPASPLARATVALPAIAALLCTWLLLYALPATHDAATLQLSQYDKLHAAVETSMAQALTVAMATGDYGEVQDELSKFARLGYFDQAVVSNNNGRVVAIEGPVDATTRIGNPISPDYLAKARTRKLALGTQAQGELAMVVPATARAASFGLTLGAAGLALLASAAAAALLYWRWRR